jgi:hypothetical protein
MVVAAVTITRHLELQPARGRQEPRSIQCLSQEYRTCPVRPSHRRHPEDLGTAAASTTEEVASVEMDSGTAAAWAEATASAEVDSAAVMAALAANRMRKKPQKTHDY